LTDTRYTSSVEPLYKNLKPTYKGYCIMSGFMIYQTIGNAVDVFGLHLGGSDASGPLF
jgi:hypothetical protein